MEDLEETLRYLPAWRRKKPIQENGLIVAPVTVSRSSTDQKKHLLSLTMHVKVASMVNPMKRTTPPRSKRTKEEKRQNPKVDMGAVKILRTVGDQEAFYFYEAIGKPTGEIAKNLPDFLDKVKSTKSESLLFHLQRRDFENWIGKTLGDSKLAGELEGIPCSSNDDVRMNLSRTVENRIKELSEPSATILADENSTVLTLPS